MTTPNVTPAAAPRTAVPRLPRGARQVQQIKLEQSSAESRRRAAAVLEVLAGLRTPLQAAQALGLALPGYYHLELRALQGLITGCEPAVKGRQKDANRELADAHAQCRKLAAEVQRYQALARAAQRTMGLAPPPPLKKPDSGKRRHKPKVRALQALALLKGPTEAAPVAAVG